MKMEAERARKARKKYIYTPLDVGLDDALQAVVHMTYTDVPMQRAAILIGVDKAGNLPKLQDAAQGARRMEAWARDQGFQTVEVFTDQAGPVDVSQIKRAVRKIVDSASCEQLLIYFAGHGVNIRYGEYWLLSDAPRDSQAAINVRGSGELACFCGIPHVVMISDACRTAPTGIAAQSINGSEIFPNDPPTGTENPVDYFYACSLGRPAHEVSDAAVTASEFRAVYTDAALAALNGSRGDVFDRDSQPPAAFLRPRKFKEYLSAEVARRLSNLQLATKVVQVPDARISSDEKAWISRIERMQWQQAGPTMADAMATSAGASTPRGPITRGPIADAAVPQAPRFPSAPGSPPPSFPVPAPIGPGAIRTAQKPQVSSVDFPIENGENVTLGGSYAPAKSMSSGIRWLVVAGVAVLVAVVAFNRMESNGAPNPPPDLPPINAAIEHNSVLLAMAGVAVILAGAYWAFMRRSQTKSDERPWDRSSRSSSPTAQPPAPFDAPPSAGHSQSTDAIITAPPFVPVPTLNGPELAMARIRASIENPTEALKNMSAETGDTFEWLTDQFGPIHHESQRGFKVRGAVFEFDGCYAKGIQLESLGPAVVRVWTQGGPNRTALLKFDKDRFVALPAIPEFLCALTFEDDELIDVSYEPSDNTTRWYDFAVQQDELRALRAIAATATRDGVFRLEPEDATKISQRLQSAKLVAPSLAIYAAYGYEGVGRRDLVKHMSAYIKSDLTASFFDVSLLARELNDTVSGQDPKVMGFAPMLDQGWSLLNANRVKLPKELENLEQCLVPSVWTMYNAEGGKMIREALEKGLVT